MCSRYRCLDLHQAHQGCSKLRRKLRIAIRDDGQWDAIVRNDVVEKQLRRILRSCRGMRRNVRRSLRKLVDNYRDSIKAIRYWQMRDEVCRDDVPVGRRQRDRLKLSCLTASARLEAHTRFAALNARLDVGIHAWQKHH